MVKLTYRRLEIRRRRQLKRTELFTEERERDKIKVPKLSECRGAKRTIIEREKKTIVDPVGRGQIRAKENKLFSFYR